MSFSRRLRSIRSKKKRLRRALRDNSALLRRGYWLLTGPAIARHISVRRLPASLTSTKSQKGVGLGATVRRLRRLLHLVVPPILANVRDRSHGRGRLPADSGYAFLVLSKAGGEILFDAACTEVVKTETRRHNQPAWQEIRQTLARYFILPKATLMQGGKSVREEFVSGDAFIAVDADTRLTVVNSLIESYVTLTARELRPAVNSFWESARTAMQTLDLPDSLRELVNDATSPLNARLETLPHAPAHGDLSGNNIIVTARGGALIDLEDCDVLPVYFDLFFLAHQELLRGRNDIWQWLVAAPGPSPMDGALEQSGETRPPPGRPDWIWASFITECYLWPRRIGSTRLTREQLCEWWRPVQAVLDSTTPAVTLTGQPG